MIMSALTQATALEQTIVYDTGKVWSGRMGSKGTVVVKYGGSAIGSSTSAVVQDIIQVQRAGWQVVLVHGGGKEINHMLERLQIQGQFVNGLRVTDSAVMEVVEMVLRGKVNTQLVAEFQQQGAHAVGLCGVDDGMIRVAPRSESLGFVGEVTEVRTEFLQTAMAQGLIPVIAPLGLGVDGVRYNINADEAAGAVAGALGANRCIFLTDVEGVLRHDPVTQTKQIMSAITPQDIFSMMESGEVYGGMIPKLQACLYALEKGAQVVQILDGRRQNVLTDALIRDQDIGTKVVQCVD
jgi:acetylglutamate kinase